MGQSIPQQHPAVVLRSHYRHLKALLAVVMLVVAALTATVVLLATDSKDPARAGSHRAGPVPGHVESISAQTAARRSAIHGKGSPVIRLTRHGAAAAPTKPSVVEDAPTERTVGIGH
jgi:hypothetical protein